MSDSPKITAIAPWFGGKRNLASKIICELGPHRVYWEPFCGSMAVLLVKPPCVMETVNDLHGDLINLARVVRDSTLAPRLYRRLRRTWMAEELFQEAADRVRSSEVAEGPDLDRAVDYMLTTWLGRNGVAGTSSYNHHFCVRYTANGGHAAKRWTSVINSIPAWHRRMRNVTILRRDAFELLPRIEDCDGTAIYVDAPYLFGSRTGSSSYIHDFVEDVSITEALADGNGEKPGKRNDHVRLALVLRRFDKTRVVVSYYDHALLTELYPGWTRRVIEVSKALAHQDRRGKNDTKAREVLLMNGPSYAKTATERMLF